MIGMRRTSLLAVGMLVLACSVLAGAQTKPSVGTVEKVYKVPATAQPAHPDAPLADEVDTYEISVRVGSVLYVVEYNAFGGGGSLDGLVGRKFEVAVQGKTLLAKTRSGRNLSLPILRREKEKSTK